MLLVTVLGYRRWLSQPWQVTLGHYMVVVAGVATALVLLTWPLPIVMFLLTLALAVFGSLRLRWHGFRLADVSTLLVVILMTAAILLPAMINTQHRTAGRRIFPWRLPQHCIERFYGRN